MVGRAWTIRKPIAVGRRGFSLMELMVVIAIVVILAAIAIPSLSGLTRVSSDGAARTALRSLFQSARSLAASKQSYVGVRFQQRRDGRTFAVLMTPPAPGDSFPGGCPNYDAACTYVTLTVADKAEPVALPRGVEFAAGDMLAAQANPDLLSLWQPSDITKKDARSYIPATTFTVLFSPTGQIVRKQVHIAQRRDGWKDFNGGWARIWTDPVFNFRGDGEASVPPDVIDKSPVTGPIGAQMDTDPAPQDQEPGPNTGITTSDTAVWQMSQGSIWVYEQEKRQEQTGLDATTCHPFTKYIQTSGSLIQLNAYTGAPVSVPQ